MLSRTTPQAHLPSLSFSHTLRQMHKHTHKTHPDPIATLNLKASAHWTWSVRCQLWNSSNILKFPLTLLPLEDSKMTQFSATLRHNNDKHSGLMRFYWPNELYHQYCIHYFCLRMATIAKGRKVLGLTLYY